MAKVIEKGAIIGLANHTVLLDRQSRERAIEDSAAPIRDPGGKLLGVVLVFHDVTARRAVEKKLLESQRQLQERLSDLEQFHDVVVGRELKMMELEEEVARLQRELAEYKRREPNPIERRD